MSLNRNFRTTDQTDYMCHGDYLRVEFYRRCVSAGLDSFRGPFLQDL